MEPVISVENPTLIPTSPEKEDPDPLVKDSDPLVARSVRVRVLWTELATRGSSTTGRGPLFQWDVGISVWFSTETTDSIRNPETRRTPSYMYVTHLLMYTFSV